MGGYVDLHLAGSELDRGVARRYYENPDLERLMAMLIALVNWQCLIYPVVDEESDQVRVRSVQ